MTCYMFNKYALINLLFSKSIIFSKIYLNDENLNFIRYSIMIMRIGGGVRIRSICEHSWETFSQSMEIRRFNGNQKVFKVSGVCKLSLQYIFLRFSRDPSRTSSDDAFRRKLSGDLPA